MADVFALLREDGSLLYARRKGDGWHVSDRPGDTGARGRKLCVFVLGTDVLGLQASIPARNEAEARRAAPFAVEDDVAEPIENSHVALGPKPEEGQIMRPVYVASNDQMQTWLNLLSAADLQDASLVAAHSVLPSGNILLEAGDLVLGRLGTRTFALERSVGDDVFLGLIDGHTDIAVHGDSLAKALRLDAAGQGAIDEQALLTTLAQWASQTTLLDLRQGAFQARRRVDMQGIKNWRLVGALAAALVVGWFTTMLVQNRAMTARTATLDKRITEFVEAGWPEANGDTQRALAQINTRRGSVGTSFPSVLTASSILFAGLETVQGSELRSLRYDRRRQQLSAVVAFDGFSGADALTAEIEKSGLSVRAGDARQSGNRVIAELTLEAGS